MAARASVAFRRGNERYAAGDFEAALAEFTHAYELLPEYKALYNIGSANVRLERWAAARRAFALYIELGLGELPPQRIQEVRGYLDVLRRKTATLTLTLNVPDAEVRLDGERIAPTEISDLVVEPGEHVLRVTKPGFRPFEQVLQATSGEEVRVVLPLARSSAPAAPRPRRQSLGAAPPSALAPTSALEERTPLWLPWAVTGALAAGWLASAGLAIEARRDRDVIEQPGTPAERVDSARRLHIALAVISDVLLASTLASAGVSAYLTWWPREQPPAGPRPASPRTISQGLSMGVAGHF